MTKKILILPGDGIGQEVTASAKEVLDFLIAEHNLDFSIEEMDAGGTAVPPASISSILKSRLCSAIKKSKTSFAEAVTS